MKVILTQNVEKLGEAGDVVEVANGFARNFLLPHDKALPATPGNLALVEQRRKQTDAASEQEREAAEELAAKLLETSCRIVKKVGESDHLYGSVTAAEIAECLEKEGFVIDKRRILLEEPIKTLGVYEVPVRLHPEVAPAVKVWVVKE
jgi:large subunit ribosomal protein L9